MPLGEFANRGHRVDNAAIHAGQGVGDAAILVAAAARAGHHVGYAVVVDVAQPPDGTAEQVQRLFALPGPQVGTVNTGQCVNSTRVAVYAGFPDDDVVGTVVVQIAGRVHVEAEPEGAAGLFP